MAKSPRASFSRLEPTSRSGHVREQLEEAIRRGDYAGGDKLPSERELSEIFGVSRVSIREAIRSLEAVGLVHVRHGAGTIVLDPARRATRDLGRWMKLHRSQVLDLLLVRGALDELAGEEAAMNGDPALIAAVGAANDAFRAAAEGEEGTGPLEELDLAFHVAVAEASGSVLLRNLLVELHGHLWESRVAVFEPGRRAARSAKEHAAIYDAIARGDGAAARSATKAHIASVREFMEHV